MTRAQHQACLEGLAEITRSADATVADAHAKFEPVCVEQASRIRQQADAARTRLVQDGDEYERTAWAVLDTCRIALAETRLRLAGARSRRYT